MYTGKLSLTNKSLVNISLTFRFENTFELQDAVEACTSSDNLCRVVNMHTNFGLRWTIDHDGADSTRLKSKDRLGNVDYLIAYKKTDSISAIYRKKILDALVKYEMTDDNADVAVAREKGQNLYKLLEEILVYAQ